MTNYLKPTTIALHRQQQSSINVSVKGSARHLLVTFIFVLGVIQTDEVVVPEQDAAHPRHHCCL
jgi:hypothetical protein